MIGEQEVKIPLPGGGEKTYVMAKFDAIAGREIVTQYPTSALPKLGDYQTNEQLMFKIMAFVQIQPVKDGPLVALATRELITNHIPDAETLMRLEIAMLVYNFSFFQDGRISNFLEDLSAKVPELILSILTPLLESYSPKVAPPSES